MLQKQDKSLKEKRSVEHGSHSNLRINLDQLIRVCSPWTHIFRGIGAIKHVATSIKTRENLSSIYLMV